MLHDEAVVADGDAQAVRVTLQSSEIGDVSLLPKEGVKACVPLGVRRSHHLPVIVQAVGKDPEKFAISAEVAEIGCLAVLPENSVSGVRLFCSIALKGPQVPVPPTTCPRSLIANAMPSGLPSTVGSSRTPDLVQMTGLNSMVCGDTDAPGQVESSSAFSAVPAAMPKSLIFIAAPLLPSLPELLRNLGSAIMVPFRQRNGAQVWPLWVRASAVDPQKSSPFLSGVWCRLGQLPAPRCSRRRQRCLALRDRGC